MRKARIAQLAGIAAAVPMLMLATTGSAFADGHGIKWADNATQDCLAWNNDNGWNLGTVKPAFPGSGSSYCVDDQHQIDWDDTQGNIQDQNGSYWRESPGGHDDMCLTAYWAGSSGVGQAYLEKCSSPANYYEQWQEQWTGSGFKLVNRETGYCLDSNSSRQVYTLPCNGGKYQLWH